MSDFQTIQALTEIIEKQNIIIRAQAEALAQFNAVCMAEQIKEVNGLVSEFIGEATDHERTVDGN